MTITSMVDRINRRLNNAQGEYDDYKTAFDRAIDDLNISWKINIPVISDSQEMTVDPTTNKKTLYNWVELPDEFIRLYIIPKAASYRLMEQELDFRVEEAEAEANLGMLATRYKLKPGMTRITKDDINYSILQGDTTGYIGMDNTNYGLRGPIGDPLDPHRED